MKINVQKGNLFELDNKKYALAHCISQDCEMGMGIAVAFDKEYRGMKSYCKRVVTENNLTFPFIITYEKNNKIVFNLVTKKNYWGKPTYNTITSTIKDMVNQCRRLNIKYLALPKIGCGLDRLSWAKVKGIIEEEFKDLDIEIEVRYL